MFDDTLKGIRNSSTIISSRDPHPLSSGSRAAKLSETDRATSLPAVDLYENLSRRRVDVENVGVLVCKRSRNEIHMSGKQRNERGKHGKHVEKQSTWDFCQKNHADIVSNKHCGCK